MKKIPKNKINNYLEDLLDLTNSYAKNSKRCKS